MNLNGKQKYPKFTQYLKKSIKTNKQFLKVLLLIINIFKYELRKTNVNLLKFDWIIIFKENNAIRTLIEIGT